MALYELAAIFGGLTIGYFIGEGMSAQREIQRIKTLEDMENYEKAIEVLDNEYTTWGPIHAFLKSSEKRYLSEKLEKIKD